MKPRRAFMNRGKLRKNKKGGIEGLPLQLLIIIVVASLGLTTMVGWMNNIEEPTTIDRVAVEADQINTDKYSNCFELIFEVYDNKGNPVEGADIVITGLGATTTAPIVTNGIIEDLLGMLGFDTEEKEDTPVVPEQPVIVPEPEDIEDPEHGLQEIVYINSITGSNMNNIPVVTTDENGRATIVVYFTGLNGTGHFDFEVSKTGLGTYKDQKLVYR